MSKIFKYLSLFLFTSIIQWYDFGIIIFLYPVINKIYFNSNNNILTPILIISIYLINIFLRPFITILLAKVGDKVGNRKNIYLYSIIFGLIFNIGIFILPSYHQIGIYSSIIFLILYTFQSLSLGLGWGASFVFLGEKIDEHFKTNYENKSNHLYISVFQIAPLIGFVLSFQVFNLIYFNNYNKDLINNWKIIFLISTIIYFIVAFIVKFYISETKEFNKERTSNELNNNNFKINFFVILLLIGLGILYTTYNYQIYFFQFPFLEEVGKIAQTDINQIIIFSTLISLPFYYVFAKIISKIKINKIILVIITFIILIFLFKIIYQKIKDLTIVKPELELVDLKEVQIKYLFPFKTADTLRKTITIKKYDNNIEIKTVEYDTLFCNKINKNIAYGNVIYVEQKIYGNSFFLISILFLVFNIVFSIFCILLHIYLYNLFPPYKRYQYITLFYNLSNSFLTILFLVSYFYAFFNSKEEQLVFDFNILALFLLLALIFILIYLIINNKIFKVIKK